MSFLRFKLAEGSLLSVGQIHPPFPSEGDPLLVPEKLFSPSPATLQVPTQEGVQNPLFHGTDSGNLGLPYFAQRRGNLLPLALGGIYNPAQWACGLLRSHHGSGPDP